MSMTWWSRLWKRNAPAAPREGARQAGKLKSEYHTQLTSERSPESRPALPFYAAIERSRTSGAHKDFSDLEGSPEINRLRDLFQSELLSSNRCPSENKPLFTTLLSGPSGFFTVTLPDSNPCLLIFSTPLRAADYARIHGASLQLKYLSSTPGELAQMLTDLSRNSAIQRFALDVCPYCLTFPVLTFSSRLTPAAVVKIWSIHKSGELARESVYFARASQAVAGGNFQEAKETALEAIQHITMESPRLHLLLGKVALFLGEKEVFCEARAFLEFLQAEQPLRELLAAEQSSKIQN